MITEFNFEGELKDDRYASNVCHAKNFPIDLKIGDEIYLHDFQDLMISGRAYCVEEIEIINKDMELPLSKVVDLTYGMENKEVVKILHLENV
jgi:hypothetical protein